MKWTSDFPKIQRNLKTMIDSGASESEIDQYLTDQSVSVEELKRYSDVKNKSLGQIVSDNATQAVQDVYSEGVSPIGKGVDMAAFGVPRILLKKYNPTLEKQLFPEQETMGGKVFNMATNIRGLLLGGAAKLSQAVGSKIIPKVAGEGMKRSMIRGGIEGAVAGGSQGFGDPAKNLVSQIGNQGIQALVSAPFGAASPLVGAGISKVKGTIQDISKGAGGYVSDVIAPKMSATIRSSMMKMDPRFVKYVEKNMNITAKSLKKIVEKGEAVLDEVFAATRGKADDIASRLQNGFSKKRELADQAYKYAMDSVPEEHVFSLDKTKQSIVSGLRKKGLIDAAGLPTERMSIAQAPDKALFDIYEDMNRVKSANKIDFTFYRDKISGLYKELGTTNLDVYQAASSLYDDAASSGFQGLQEARSLQRAAFDAEKQFGSSQLLKEQKLSKYNKWTTKEQKDFDEILKYIEEDLPVDQGILDDLTSTIASSDLQVFKMKTGPEAVRGELLQAKDPENFNTLKKKWVDILGEDADPIFNEVSHSVAGAKLRSIATGGALVATGVGALGYGAYRLGREGIDSLIQNFGASQ
jgi:hypothetical protein